jgi:hypothetical protein
MPTTSYTLDNDTAAFITHHVSMIVASASRDNAPSLSRAYGCAVAADRRSLTVMLFSAHCQTLLADLRDTGQLAVVASNPSSHKTIQLKGKLLSIAPLRAADRIVMQQFVTSFGEDIKLLGYNDDFIRAITPDITADGVRIDFNPTASFIATPGPQAGKTLGSAP